MKETALTAKFKRNMTKECNKAGLPLFYYKIPDTKGTGGLRPFDGFLVLCGKFFAIEFKVGRNKLEPHQKYCLDKVTSCGGRSLIIRETNVDQMIKSLISTAITAKNIMKKYNTSFKKVNGGK